MRVGEGLLHCGPAARRAGSVPAGTNRHNVCKTRKQCLCHFIDELFNPCMGIILEGWNFSKKETIIVYWLKQTPVYISSTKVWAHTQYQCHISYIR